MKLAAPSSSVLAPCAVLASRARPPVAFTVTPEAAHIAAAVRSAEASNPTPVPTRPARVRPYPRCTATVSSAWPGTIHAGPATVRPPAATSTTSSLRTPSRAAVAGLSCTVLSQVSFVNGFGSSCSQPRLAKPPSWTVGSGLSTRSRPAAAARWAI